LIINVEWFGPGHPGIEDTTCQQGRRGGDLLCLFLMFEEAARKPKK